MLAATSDLPCGMVSTTGMLLYLYYVIIDGSDVFCNFHVFSYVALTCFLLWKIFSNRVTHNSTRRLRTPLNACTSSRVDMRIVLFQRMQNNCWCGGPCLRPITLLPEEVAGIERFLVIGPAMACRSCLVGSCMLQQRTVPIRVQRESRSPIGGMQLIPYRSKAA